MKNVLKEGDNVFKTVDNLPATQQSEKTARRSIITAAGFYEITRDN